MQRTEPERRSVAEPLVSMASPQGPMRQVPDVGSLKLTYLIPASPIDGLYSQIAMFRMALNQLGDPYSSAQVIAAIGAPPGTTVPARWRDALSGVTVNFVEEWGDRRFRAQVNGRWSMVPEDTDVVVFADADTVPVARIDDLLERVVTEQVVAGKIAGLAVPFLEGISVEDGWRDAARQLLDRDITLDYRTTLPDEHGNTEATAFYLNFGAVFMPYAVYRVLRPAYLDIEPRARYSLRDRRFSAQLALALAIHATKVPQLAVGARYNFSNDPRQETAHPDELADIRTVHYNSKAPFDRSTVFSDPAAFRAFLALPLAGANAVMQRRVHELTDGRYPFPLPDEVAARPASTAQVAPVVGNMRSPASVRAVIVNFHRYDLVEACIRALDNSIQPPHEIVIVDNETEPESLAALARDHPTIRTIPNKGNVGYARACNQGAAGATTDYVLFINPDVTVSPSCLALCVQAAERSANVAIVTPRLIRPDGRLDHACHRGIPTPSASLAYAFRLNRLFPGSHRFARYTMSWLDPATDHDVEACSGAFMLVRRSDLDAIGGWDERYWFYGEDLDLCFRLGTAGKRVRYLGTVTATHIKGASSGLHSRTGKPDRATRARVLRLRQAIVESHRLFFRQHLRPVTKPPVSLAIEAMFQAQRLKIRTQLKLESLRGS